MNFFEHQAQAHRESKKLLFLFLLAVICIVFAVNGTLAFVWTWFMHDAHGNIRAYPHYFFETNTALIILFIGGGTLIEMLRLRDGGDAVAQMAGGRLVQPNSRDMLERRLLNIVEEMSLASGIACPRVYVMDKEDAINAFAAGYQQNEAVVAVTRGTLTRLNRDELQGVIGHEFSHILNGDMRMNIKLIGVLFGIQMLSEFGRYLIDGAAKIGGGSGEKGTSLKGFLFVTGVAFFAIGYIGVFFGRLIKSAVSRQREFLADASAVQFTRNLDGIGGALRKIAGLTKINQCGSRIHNIHAEQFSHMFLGAAKTQLLSGFFATHPPIEKRLQKLYGRKIEALNASELPAEEDARDFIPGVSGFSSTTTSLELSHDVNTVPEGAFHPLFGYQSNTKNAIKTEGSLNFESEKMKTFSLPNKVIHAARNPLGACELVFALFLDSKNKEAYQTQQLILHQVAIQQVFHAQELHHEIELLPRTMRLPLLDLAMPALKLLTQDQRKHLLGVVSRLIAADNMVSQNEFVAQVVLQRRLSQFAGRSISVRYSNLTTLKKETALLLSLMVHNNYVSEQAQNAFMKACLYMPDIQLQKEDFYSKTNIDFYEVKLALDKMNHLAPLAKPFLIRLLMQASQQSLSIDAADLVRGICAAIDAPIPEAVSATYGVHQSVFDEVLTTVH